MRGVACIAVVLAVIDLVTGSQICLSCVEALRPRDCEYIVRCSAQSQCYVDQYLNSLGFLRYDLGCRDAAVCSGGGGGPSSQVGRRDPVKLHICNECCIGPLCNNQGCRQDGYPPQHGPICQNCYNQLHASDCDKIAVCGSSEVCAFVQQRSQTTSDVYYSTMCQDRRACLAESSRPGVTCHACCEGDLCNSGCNPPGMLTTPAPTHDYCMSQPCVQGTCTSLSSGYSCTCNPGYEGSRCDKVISVSGSNACQPDPCGVHGTCRLTVTGAKFACQCDDWHEGTLCTQSISSHTSSGSSAGCPDLSNCELGVTHRHYDTVTKCWVCNH